MALPAAAAERVRDGASSVGAHQVVAQVGSNPDNDIKVTVTWMIVGIAIAAVVLGTLYLFKRRVGGFPENPTWVAPITIMRSEDLPQDDGSNPPPNGGGGHAPQIQEHAAGH